MKKSSVFREDLPDKVYTALQTLISRYALLSFE